MDRLAGIVARLPSHRETQRRVQELIAEERSQMRRYCWKRRQRDPIFAVTNAMRTRVRAAVRSCPRADSIWGLVGCTGAELRAHLEKQFQPGMSWENFPEWEIDHIRPCCSFNLSEPSEQYACFHFSNLQPLWATENRRKSGKYHAA